MVKKKVAITPEETIAFLKTVRPFDQLSDADLKRISKAMGEVDYPQGAIIFTQGLTEITQLYIIQQGGVRLYLKDENDQEVLEEYRGAGDYFGALGIIMDTRANLFVESLQETRCLLLPREDFDGLLATKPPFCYFFLKSFCRRYIHSAHFELQKKEMRARDESNLFLFTQDIGGVLKGTLHTCSPSDTAQDAATKMARHGIGSLLIKTDDGEVQGIITDKDLRNKLVANGLSCAEPVSTIMSSPVKTAPSEAVCFDALFTMLKNRIHHLGVQREGQIVGMITAHDILLLQGASPIFLFKEISAQPDIKGLYPIPEKFPGVVRRLIEDGARAGNVNRMITVLNDQILDRILTLLIKELGPPPVAFCWIVMGSEGRKEQTFKTDQDNAIILEDLTGSNQEEVRNYFFSLAEKAVDHLAACGYALCKGNMMASNPDWNQPLSIWKATFDRWVFSPDPKEVLNSTIFFDFRPAFGKTELALALREHLLRRTMHEKVFIHHLARDCQAKRPPLTLLKNFVVEKEGPHRGQLDLKTRGLAPFVDFARLMCLDQGLPFTNTLERIQALGQHKTISKEFAQKISEAYEFQMQLRLDGQMQALETGRAPDNHVDPLALSDVEKLRLKKAFQVIDEMQSFLANRFHLNLG